MIIQGPYAIQADRASGTREAVWIQCETAQSADITKGQLCAWDTVDNTAVSGILQNTKGLRVVVCPTAEASDVADGKRRVAGFAHTTIPGFAGFASGRSATNLLLQVYGFRNDVVADTDGASDIVVGGSIGPSGDTPGAVEGSQITVPTGNEVLKTVGMSFEAVAINNVVVINAWIRCM